MVAARGFPGSGTSRLLRAPRTPFLRHRTATAGLCRRMEIARERSPLVCPAVLRETTGELARKCQKRFVELGQVGVEPVIAGAPSYGRLIRWEIEHGEVVCRRLLIGQFRELIADISGGVLADDALAFVDREYGAEHTLVLCVGLAKIKGRHTKELSAIRRKA